MAEKRKKWKVQNKEIIGREKFLKKWQKREKWKVQNKEIIGRANLLKKWQKSENWRHLNNIKKRIEKMLEYSRNQKKWE